MGKFVFLKLRSGEMFYFCAFFAILIATSNWDNYHQHQTDCDIAFGKAEMDYINDTITDGLDQFLTTYRTES